MSFNHLRNTTTNGTSLIQKSEIQNADSMQQVETSISNLVTVKTQGQQKYCIKFSSGYVYKVYMKYLV
jgi:hypothetical protein